MNEAAVAEIVEFWPEWLDAGLALFTPALAFLASGIRLWRSAWYAGPRDHLGENLRAAIRREVLHIIALHDRFYDWIAGTHPYRRPWHRQWLSVKDVYRDLRSILPTLEGELLDVGCMGKPYARWMSRIQSHVGIDVVPGPTVDCIIRDGEPWSLESGRFQCVLCTQVMQVVKNRPHLVDELSRVLACDGIAVIAAPFCCNDMSTPRDDGVYKDYCRYSYYGLCEIFERRFTIVDIRRQGGFGSTVGVLVLNWIHVSLSRRLFTRLLLVPLLPAWLAFCLFVNIMGWLFDKLDRTNAFYHNVLLIVRKPAD
jgi:SAM-dependent methyltransferase